MTTADEYRQRLERAGWSVRELPRDAPAGTAWGVSADREGERVWGFGPTPAAAWRDACRQAAALGLLPAE